MKAVIMAGGFGTRIRELFPDIPKPLIPIGGKPVLEREVECLRKQGFTELIFTVCNQREKVMEYFGDGSRFGVSVRYFEETVPLGNAGALFYLRGELTEDFLLLNADSLFDIDFGRLVDFHREKGGKATLFTHPNSHPYDSGLILTDGDGAVKEWLTKEDPRPDYYDNRVNAGLHVLSPSVIDAAWERRHPGELPPWEKNKLQPGASADGAGQMETAPEKWDLDRDLLKPLAGTGTMFAYDSPEYVKDMGTPERYRAVNADFENGIVTARNLKNRQKAVFLDRDGTINYYVPFCHRLEDFHVLPWAAEAIGKINAAGYLAIVVTNQPVIARGEMSFEELDLTHKKMQTELGEKGAYLDAIYFCPHHPDKGFAGERPELKFDCDCRKPKPGMFLKAAERFNIDLSQSVMVGDDDRDMKAGEAAGCRKNILVKTNEPWTLDGELD